MPRVAPPNPVDDAELGVPQQEPYTVNLPLQVQPTSSWVSQVTVQSETSTSSSSSSSATSQPPTHALPVYPPRPAEAAKEPTTVVAPSSSGTVPEAKAEQSPEPLSLDNRPRPVLTPRKAFKASTNPWIRWQLWYNTYRFVPPSVLFIRFAVRLMFALL